MLRFFITKEFIESILVATAEFIEASVFFQNKFFKKTKNHFL
jgi:hypothetical protein